jgi:hypothetical protein
MTRRLVTVAMVLVVAAHVADETRGSAGSEATLASAHPPIRGTGSRVISGTSMPDDIRVGFDAPADK